MFNLNIFRRLYFKKSLNLRYKTRFLKENHSL